MSTQTQFENIMAAHERGTLTRSDTLAALGALSVRGAFDNQAHFTGYDYAAQAWRTWPVEQDIDKMIRDSRHYIPTTEGRAACTGYAALAKEYPETN